MSDYIDRESVGEQFHKLIVAFYSAYEKDGKEERLAALLEIDLAARSAINAIPAADVAEVRHGRWTPWSYKGMGLLPVSGWKCSECGVIMDGIEDTPTAYHLHYCPNCGAKMDESEGEEDV